MIRILLEVAVNDHVNDHVNAGAERRGPLERISCAAIPLTVAKWGQPLGPLTRVDFGVKPARG